MNNMMKKITVCLILLGCTQGLQGAQQGLGFNTPDAVNSGFQIPQMTDADKANYMKDFDWQSYQSHVPGAEQAAMQEHCRKKHRARFQSEINAANKKIEETGKKNQAASVAAQVKIAGLQKQYEQAQHGSFLPTAAYRANQHLSFVPAYNNRAVLPELNTALNGQITILPLPFGKDGLPVTISNPTLTSVKNTRHAIFNVPVWATTQCTLTSTGAFTKTTIAPTMATVITQPPIDNNGNWQFGATIRGAQWTPEYANSRLKQLAALITCTRVTPTGWAAIASTAATVATVYTAYRFIKNALENPVSTSSDKTK